jgi:hypothetical protein
VKIFLSGIIQGSNLGRELNDQGYRHAIKDILRAHCPAVEVVCPMDLHPDSVDYAPDLGKETFLTLVQEAKATDALIAYLPSASMGTAIEIWEAYRAGMPIYTITPMTTNWVINFFSTRVFETLPEFEFFVSQGGLDWLARK